MFRLFYGQESDRKEREGMTCCQDVKMETGLHEAYGVTGLEPAALGVSACPVEHIMVWRVMHQTYHYYNDVI